MGTVQLQPYLPNTAELAGLVQSNDAGYEWQSHFTKGCQALGAHSANQTTLRRVTPAGRLHKPRIREVFALRAASPWCIYNWDFLSPDGTTHSTHNTNTPWTRRRSLWDLINIQWR